MIEENVIASQQQITSAIKVPPFVWTEIGKWTYFLGVIVTAMAATSPVSEYQKFKDLSDCKTIGQAELTKLIDMASAGRKKK